MYSLRFHGKRLLELQKWRNLGSSVNVLFVSSNSYSSASLNPRDDPKGNTFTVSYLVESFGLTTKLAESIFRKVTFKNKSNPDSVLSLLKSLGFTNSQISGMVTDYPLMLTLDAKESIDPKLQFLKSRGASNSELIDIISKVPKILGLKVGTTMARYYDFVSEFIESGKSSKFKNFDHSLVQSKQDNIIRNVLILREVGVPQKRLLSMLISFSSPLCGKERFEKSLKKVVEMGFDPNAAKFMLALRVVYGSIDKTIEEKMDVYVRLGLSVEEVWVMFKEFPQSLGISIKNIEESIEIFISLGFSKDEFALMVKRHPACIGYSAETVKKKIEFLVKNMKWSLKGLVSNPAVLGYSLDNRTIPRCNVIRALMFKGLIGSEIPSVASLLRITDEAFLNKYVMKYDDKQLVSELIDIFQHRTM